MKLPGPSPVHLTYCTNIHPGETWDEVMQNLSTHTLAVKQRVSPDAPFGVGLRLSGRAARELETPEALDAFLAFLARHDLYVFTLNGFPYGPFHGQSVKDAVYRPDWSEPERVDYSDRLARILAVLLRATPGWETAPWPGSISTVPGCFRARGQDPAATRRIVENLLAHTATLHRIARAGGPEIGLALEPEPACLLETNIEAVQFLKDALFARTPCARFATLSGCAPEEAESILRRHLGLCIDTCHAAVEFESPDETLAHIARAGVRVLKLQVTAGLRLSPTTEAGLAVLGRFDDAVYLHQTVIRRGQTLIRHDDLPVALAAARALPNSGLSQTDEWRTHFHVPLYHGDLSALCPGFSSTQDIAAAFLSHHAKTPISSHLEVETYTWSVLPEDLRALSVDQAIVRELEWTRIRATAPCPR